MLSEGRCSAVAILREMSKALAVAQGFGESRRKPCTSMSVLSTVTSSGTTNLLGGVVVASPNLYSSRIPPGENLALVLPGQ
jgi:hypothetical protein